MAFQDYSANPASNTTIGDDKFIGPNMPRDGVRPALQQLAADGRDLYDTVIAMGANGTLPQFIQSGTGAVARTVQDKVRDASAAPEDYGAVGNAVEGSGTTLTGTDDTAAFLAALAALEAAGGGTLQCSAGNVYRLSGQLTIPAGVRLNLNEAKLVFQLANANDCGVQLRTNTIVENGHIRIISQGSPASQAAAHAPVRVGPLYGSGGTVASPSADDNAANWEVRNLIVESDKDLGAISTGGAAGIAVMGNSSSGKVSGVVVPDNAHMTMAVGCDWGTRGEVDGNEAIVSAPTSMGTNLTNFLAGDGHTTHPHNIVIENITVGRLSRPLGGGATTGSFAVRLSGCYNVQVMNVSAAQTTEAAFSHHAGDLGFEFATGNDLINAMRGNSFTNCKVDDAVSGSAIQLDSEADNVQTAITSHGYTAQHPWGALWPTDVTFTSISGRRTTGTATFGINAFDLDGGRLVDCKMTGFLNALRLDDARNLIVEGGRFTNSSGSNIVIEGGSANGVLRDIRECHTCGAGTDNVFLDVCSGFTIDGGTFGRVSGEPGRHTINAQSGSCTDLSIVNTPTVLGHGSGNYAFIFGGSSDENVLRVFGGARFGAGVTTNKWFGQYRPYSRSGDGVLHANGEGAPNGNVTAAPGSTFNRTNGGAGTTFYVKQTGTDNNGWGAVA